MEVTTTYLVSVVFVQRKSEWNKAVPVEQFLFQLALSKSVTLAGITWANEDCMNVTMITVYINVKQLVKFTLKQSLVLLFTTDTQD